MFYYLAIALTGSVVLGIEVLSSRILTPYFGVSLYIWASILTVTLICLAVGYFYGGILTRKKDVEGVRSSFNLFVSVASIAVCLAAFLYPHIFPVLMKLPLVMGSLFASVVLMVVPLVLMSALNPIVMVLVRQEEKLKGDAGAGLVFFISTLGSVVGVVITAFIFIPYLSNTVGLLVFALITALLSLVAAATYLRGRQKIRALALAGIAAACSLALLVVEVAFPTTRFVDKQGAVWNLREERHSIFGSVKVVDRGEGAGMARFYLNDGLFQDVVGQNGQSIVMFTYTLDILLKQYAPATHNVLFLGLAAGVVPRNFPPAQYQIEVVEINPDSVEVAKKYFGFDEQGRKVHVQDARTFVNGCNGRFDAVVFDMFHGDGVPDYLLTREFFQQLKSCVTPGGVIVMNLMDDRQSPQVRDAILSTVNTAFSNLNYFQDTSSNDAIRNAFLVASNGELAPTTVQEIVPGYLRKIVRDALESGRRIEKQDYNNAPPLTDDHNIFSVLSADTNMRFRKMMQTALPAGLYKS
ncbi:MAG: fused MFS/spermidine synthase [Gallionellaceae bacterium]